MGSKGHDRITADGKKFFAEIEKLIKLQARVGYQRGKNTESETGADLVDVAAWNELGTKHIPARPFMRRSVDDNKNAITQMCKTQLSRLTGGDATAEDILNKLGLMQKGLIQKKISDGDFEPNADSTRKRKKSSRPLVDTGTLRNSVDFVIEEKGGDTD